MLNFACAQNTDVYNSVTTEILNTIMSELNSSVDNSALNNLNATANAKSEDQWGSFPWGGADAASSANKNELRAVKDQLKQLQRELTRKEKALAEAAALLILQKKFNALWEGEDK
jgi:hypothetical protein